MTLAAWDWHGHAILAALGGFLLAWLFSWWLGKRAQQHEVVHRRVVETTSDESTKLKTLVDQHDTALGSLRSEHDGVLAGVRGDYDAQIASLKSGHDGAIAALRAEHDAALARVRGEHDAELGRVRGEHGAEVSALKAEHDGALGSLRSEHDGALASLRADHDGALAGVRGELEGQIASLKGEHEAALGSLRSEHDGALASLRADHDGAVASLKAEHDGVLTSVRSEHEAALGSLRSEHEAALGSLRSEHDSRLGERDAQILGLRGQLDEASAPPDDLLVIEGVGPKINQALRAAGITRWVQVRDASQEQLKAALEAGGIGFAPSMTTWSKQAAYLVDGDQEGFRQYTEYLVAGQDPAALGAQEESDDPQTVAIRALLGGHTDHSALVPAEAKHPDGSDNLLMIEGIGPKFRDALHGAGITTFAGLATSSADGLRSAIQAAGLSFAPSLDTWSEQAALLARGELSAFQALTERLVAGRRDG